MNAKQLTKYRGLKASLRVATEEYSLAVKAHIYACDNYLLNEEGHTSEWYATTRMTDQLCLDADEKVRVAYRAMVDYYNEVTK